MSKFNQKKTLPRYMFIAILMTMLACAVVAKALYIMTAQRDFWQAVADRNVRDSVEVKPMRGNILSCDGQLMVSSLPEYKLFMDFRALHDAGTDSLWEAKLDSICLGLNDIFPEKSAAKFRSDLEEGRAKRHRHWPIWKSRVSYNTYSEVRKLPIFCLSANKGGFHKEEYNARKRQFGNLASRTLGDLYGAKDTARFGLELSYDSILRGHNGLINRRKVLNKYLDITLVQPIDGADIVTTIDVGMQDLAERAVLDELKEVDARVGVAIVMEVATGDIKAIVNMERTSDGRFAEMKNHAVSDLLEPGSVFKTASLLVALDDEKVDTTLRVETGGGIWMMYGRAMKDHNWHRGGYGTLTLPKVLYNSSNIGTSRIIDDNYRHHPEQFVEGIYRTGLADDLELPFFGSTPARIRMPKKDKTGKHWANWSNTALPWMSIGYETQIPPISTLTFYNTIANNGKMMRPRFVSKVVKDGKVLEEYPPEVMRESIVKHPAALKKIQTMLEGVVSQGTGKKAGSKTFKVAGKTGTAQIWTSAGKSASYLLSFAGYFPADNPRYSCIVCLQKTGLPASGGFSAKVFHDIAEGIMAKSLKLLASDARDSLSSPLPDVKAGNVQSAKKVLNDLGIRSSIDWDARLSRQTIVWGTAESQRGKRQVALTKSRPYAARVVPDVTGMGARDAVYLLEKRGLRTRIVGRGKVKSQSLPVGHIIKKGELCILTMN